jgi:hypothetical protein
LVTYSVLTLDVGIFSGSDLGPLIFSHYGLLICVRCTVWFLLAAFRGNEAHGGTSPSLKPKGAAELLKFMEEIWKGTPPLNHCGWVVYRLWAAITQAVSVAVSPALTFMNQRAPALHKETYLNFSEHAAESKLLGDLCRAFTIDSIVNTSIIDRTCINTLVPMWEEEGLILQKLFLS